MRTLRPVGVGLVVAAIALACDRSPTAVSMVPLPSAQLTLTSQPTANRTSAPLVSCSQRYDSVTEVVGPLGGLIAVGHHYLWVDSLALARPTSITVVAPAGAVRWVRFRPDGLVFQTKTRTGYPAVIFTDYTNCAVPTSNAVRIAQVTDALGVLGYLQTYVRFNTHPWSQGPQYVAAVLPHFSNYAVAW